VSRRAAPAALATTCAARKDPRPGLLPAWQRYRSPRIQHVRALAGQRQLPFLILSGRFGLLAAEEAIPSYDHLLLSGEVEDLLAQVVRQLEAFGLTRLEFHHRPLEVDPLLAPYLDLMTRACRAASVELSLVELHDLAGLD